MKRKTIMATVVALFLAGMLSMAFNLVEVPSVAGQFSVDEYTIALWHFDEGTGSAVYDATANNNDGTISGATWTTGKFGSALYFHGGGQWHDGDCVTVPHSPSLDITGRFTVEAWIKAKGTDHYLVIVDKYYNVPTNKGFTLYLTDGKLRLSIYSEDAIQTDVFGTSELRDDTWHHVAGMWDGSYARVYVDEKLEGEVPWTVPPASTTNDLGIGKRLSGWGCYAPFLGTIDEVRISNIARVPSYCELTVTSSPITGITFTIDGVPETTPYTEWLLEGFYTLEMPETHNGYVWSHWLEDGDTSRTKTITLPDTTWTGVYVPAPSPPAVGGEMILVKVDKPPSLAPTYTHAWIGLISVITSTVAVSVVYAKHRKRKQTE